MLKVCCMWKPEFDDRLGEQTTAKLVSLLEGFLAVPIHHRHAAALPVLRVEMKLKTSLHAKHICSPDAVQQAVMEYIPALEYIIPHPSDYLVQQACDVAVLVCASSAFQQRQRRTIAPRRCACSCWCLDGTYGRVFWMSLSSKVTRICRPLFLQRYVLSVRSLLCARP